MKQTKTIKELFGSKHKHIHKALLCEKHIAVWFPTIISIFSAEKLNKINSIEIRNCIEFCSLKENTSGRFPIAQFQPNDLGWMYAITLLENFDEKIIEAYNNNAGQNG